MSPKPAIQEQAEEAAERQGLRISNRVLTWAVGSLFLLVQSLFTYQTNSAAAEIKETNHTLTEVLSNQKVQQIENRVTNERLANLEGSRKEDAAEKEAMKKQITSLEQRQALTDQWIESHK